MLSVGLHLLLRTLRPRQSFILHLHHHLHHHHHHRNMTITHTQQTERKDSTPCVCSASGCVWNFRTLVLRTCCWSTFYSFQFSSVFRKPLQARPANNPSPVPPPQKDRRFALMQPCPPTCRWSAVHDCQCLLLLLTAIIIRASHIDRSIGIRRRRHTQQTLRTHSKCESCGKTRPEKREREGERERERFWLHSSCLLRIRLLICFFLFNWLAHTASVRFYISFSFFRRSIRTSERDRLRETERERERERERATDSTTSR